MFIFIIVSLQPLIILKDKCKRWIFLFSKSQITNGYDMWIKWSIYLDGEMRRFWKRKHLDSYSKEPFNFAMTGIILVNLMEKPFYKFLIRLSHFWPCYFGDEFQVWDLNIWNLFMLIGCILELF